MILDVQHSKIKGLRSLASPLKLHGTPNTTHHSPPLLGEHTDTILQSLLGLNEADLNDLRDKKVIN
jgi:crotonobetainyl-CoA:carnitine CoA-transferase CaiB-like acyl-CoA transferase